MNNLNRLDLKLNHRNWNEALAYAFNSLITALPGEVILLLGPSRSGKTRLILELIKMLCGNPRNDTTSSYLCSYILAKNTGPHGIFSTKAFTFRMLQMLDHPSFKLSVSDLEMAARFDRITENAMSNMLERAFANRGVRYLVIDEAQHARYVTKGAQAAHAVLDGWKSLAESSGFTLVLVGTYPILNVMQNSPHLLGRTRTIHLPRYKAEASDLSHFYSIASKFLECLDTPIDFELKQEIQRLHRQTFGCIGLLRSLLIAANNLACSTETMITSNILDLVFQPAANLESIWSEIEEGERSLETLKIETAGYEVSEGKNPKPKGKTPFQRKPARIPAGNRSEKRNY
ncbi:AAA family ATPase [Aestuariibacter salexigens]|uniref:AAA family ATPase n=1 Tax=Aestuariibacter salexigens TaxID=226010 RepID=UPI00040F88F5|nr:AAA family ATPase [Aestuariibacter salexigens]